jgi:glycerol-3-phosphate dehydrogenase
MASPTRSMKSSRIAVIGGGINGVMTAWALVNAGAKVTLFEAGQLMSQTSCASTKMLHGGLRYLAQFKFSMVRESLQERRWWQSQNTGLVDPIAIVVPIRNYDVMKWLLVWCGVKLYDRLASGSGFPTSRWVNRNQLRQRFPTLKAGGLMGGWEYWDAQMQDQALGLWAVRQAIAAGLEVREDSRVQSMTIDGSLTLSGSKSERFTFDLIVNAAGPWAESLLDASLIPHETGLTLIRGTHLLVSAVPSAGLALPHKDGRLIFFLPYQARGLLGTTEEVQSIDDPIKASSSEVDELLSCYADWFQEPLRSESIKEVFSGLRPVVRQKKKSLSSASREAVIESRGRLITVWGGKWTTSRRLGLSVAGVCDQLLAVGKSEATSKVVNASIHEASHEK